MECRENRDRLKTPLDAEKDEATHFRVEIQMLHKVTSFVLQPCYITKGHLGISLNRSYKMWTSLIPPTKKNCHLLWEFFSVMRV